jgi:DNA-binding transcriptional ArsR family regulator
MTAKPNNKITPHLLRLLSLFETSEGWLSTARIAEGAKISLSTARHHAVALYRMGILEREQLYPEFYYKLSSQSQETEFYQHIKEVRRVVVSTPTQSRETEILRTTVEHFQKADENQRVVPKRVITSGVDPAILQQTLQMFQNRKT